MTSSFSCPTRIMVLSVIHVSNTEQTSGIVHSLFHCDPFVRKALDVTCPYINPQHGE
jgi:hypothetical protein